jgi:RecB family exonuclease
MLDHEPDILLPNPILVEGQAPGSVDQQEKHDTTTALDGKPVEMQAADAVDEERDAGYTALRGTIGGVAVAGVPDIVALHADGETIRVGDYKTGRPIGREELEQDAQLAIYTQLLRQNGYIAPDQPVQIGHIYLTDSGPVQVWAATAQHARVLHRLEAQLAHAAALIAADLIIPRKGVATGFMSPCALCDVAHVCDA